MCFLIAMLLQIFWQNFYSNTSCFSLLLLYLGNSQVSVYRTIGPTLVMQLCVCASIIWFEMPPPFKDALTFLSLFYGTICTCTCVHFLIWVRCPSEIKTIGGGNPCPMDTFSSSCMDSFSLNNRYCVGIFCLWPDLRVSAPDSSWMSKIWHTSHCGGVFQRIFSSFSSLIHIYKEAPLEVASWVCNTATV